MRMQNYTGTVTQHRSPLLSCIYIESDVKLLIATYPTRQERTLAHKSEHAVYCCRQNKSHGDTVGCALPQTH